MMYPITILIYDCTTEPVISIVLSNNIFYWLIATIIKMMTTLTVHYVSPCHFERIVMSIETSYNRNNDNRFLFIYLVS